jgi:transcription-repair coupling factor (superfamily II helicase)
LAREAAWRSDGEVEGHPEILGPILPPEGVRAARLAEIASRTGLVHVAGAAGSATACIAATIAKSGSKVVLVTSDLEEARKSFADVGFFLSTDEDEETGTGDVLLLAPSETSPFAEVNPDRREAMARLATLAHLASGKDWRVLVVPASALVRKLVPREAIRSAIVRVVAEDELDRDATIQALVRAGYLRVPVVEDPGTFAVRGSLLDVWAPNLPDPVRIELYGDLVMSIEPFDPFDQRTKKTRSAAGEVEGTKLSSVAFAPAREAILGQKNIERARERVQAMADAIDWPTKKTRALIDDLAAGRSFFGADAFLPVYYPSLESLFSYVPPDATIVLAEPAAITRAVRAELELASRDASAKEGGPMPSVEDHFGTEEEAVMHVRGRRTIAVHRSAVVGGEGEGLAAFEIAGDALDIAARSHEELTRAVRSCRAQKGKTGTLEPLVKRIAHWRSHGLSVVLTARADTQAERLATLLDHQGVKCELRFGKVSPLEPISEVTVITGPLSRGVLLPADGLVLVTEEEIFGSRARRADRRRERKAEAFLEDLRSLSVGDYVVHVDHGIGQYQGLVHKEIGGAIIDMLVVAYAAGDKLYLPVTRLNQIQKYAAQGAQPKLDRLGGSTFAKAKARAAKAVRQMADELLRLYAERKARHRPAMGGIDDDYRSFEATFPFDETPDQSRAIDEVNKDLDKEEPMDRLVCGDVGFGKTEVALRAAYRAVLAGKQVALLCPTTVLAQQHYRTFEGRLRDLPVVLRVLSRFQSKKDQQDTVLLLKEGKCDIVVGTHRLLSKDVHFKNLGLLVVDEEQRFGVAHKERIKQLRTEVDVLTLTATPIPRTLQMAIGGLRDLSLITTPPTDRRAVRTVVTRWDAQVVREAIERELSRGGQVFYVYNRVEGIYERAQRVKELVPNANVVVAHGQLSENVLEQVMLDFVEGRYDVLVATAIIESGLDIPRANTILIDRADMFGLAQLYQLRGRVGRSKERAYCYLIVPPPSAMTDEARSRIEALERHTELGSGFQIASLDLELRGAGDLLGAEQSGAVASVGFDMFVHMLEDAVHELRGEQVVHDVEPELSFDVSALLPEDYVPDVGVRLSLYKRLASAVDESQVSDLATEMEERFGPPPEEARRYIKLMAIKTELRRLRVLGCEANTRSVTLHLREDTPLDPQKITDLVRQPKSPWRLTPDMRLSRRFDVAGAPEVRSGLQAAEIVLEALAALVKPS